MSNVTSLEKAFQEAVGIGNDAEKDNLNEDDESEYEVIEDEESEYEVIEDDVNDKENDDDDENADNDKEDYDNDENLLTDNDDNEHTDSDGHDDEPVTRRYNGYGVHLKLKLSPELQAVIGVKTASRYEAIERLWAYIEENNLLDPEERQFFCPDDKLGKIFGRERVRAFGMAKYLSSHIYH